MLGNNNLPVLFVFYMDIVFLLKQIALNPEPRALLAPRLLDPLFKANYYLGGPVPNQTVIVCLALGPIGYIANTIKNKPLYKLNQMAQLIN